MDELVDIIDDDGNILRQELKTEAHKHGWRHKTVIGYLKEGDDWWLVRRATGKQDAGQLVAPVGGHVAAGESDEDALLRESEEEIGTRNIRFKHKGSKAYRRNVLGRDENHLFVVYEIETDDPVLLSEEESVAIERFTPTELKRLLKEVPENFGAPYFFVLETFFPEQLPAGYVARYI